MSLPEGSKPVCVFCASSPGDSEIYSTAAAAVGTALAKNGFPLVYGGGRRGLMGVVSSSALEAGGRVHGILPRALMARASEHTPTPSRDPSVAPVSAEGIGKDLLADTFGGLLSMEVVGSMHERKAKMASLSTGGFVTLPGGYGTFEELLEMVTWNQIGVHSLPVVVLNVNNFYSPLRQLFEQGAASGFIKRENLQLLRIVDLPGGAEANADAARAAEWGDVAVAALREWHIPTGAGYGFKWDDVKAADLGLKPNGNGNGDKDADVSLFTTARYSLSSGPLTPDAIPLWDYHVRRLRNAHAHFAKQGGWGTYPGDEAVWSHVCAALEGLEPDAEGRTECRVKVLLSRPGPGETAVRITVETPRAALPPFMTTISESLPRRKLWIDSQATPSPGKEEEDYRLFKTTRREVYESAQARFADREPHAEVLLWNEDGIALEGTTSNFAIQTLEGWVTPRVRELLPGAARSHLLDAGAIREVDAISVEQVKAAPRIVCFNGLRGVWEADLQL